MPKASRKGSFAVGEAGAKLAGAFESEAANLAQLFYDWTISRLDDLASHGSEEEK